jgi:hypothetical protein
MASVADTSRLIEDVVRLRRAERVSEAARDVRPVRRNLESHLKSTLSRSRTARILGVSQTAFDRWVDAGRIPVVMTPTGRREVPRRFVIELRELIDELIRQGQRRHLLAAALSRRRDAAKEVDGCTLATRGETLSVAHGHETAELRSRAFHAVVAERLDDPMLEEASEEVERLVAEGHLHEHYAERWRGLLACSPAEVAHAIVADNQEGRDLRQNSPFAGALNEEERRRIVETIG